MEKVYRNLSAPYPPRSFPSRAEKVPPGATTGTLPQEYGSIPFPVIIVCCPFTIPLFGVLIAQQEPVWPDQFVKSPVSKSAFVHSVCANIKTLKISVYNRRISFTVQFVLGRKDKEISCRNK